MFFPQRFQLSRGGITAIGMAAGQQFARHLGMAIGAGELIDHIAIPLKIQPGHAIQNRGNRRFGGAGAIGVFNAQAEFAAMVAGEQPVEQRRARPADVQKTGGGRGKAGDDFGCAHALNIQCCG